MQKFVFSLIHYTTTFLQNEGREHITIKKKRTVSSTGREILYIFNNCCQVVSMRDSLWLCKTFSFHCIVSLALLLYHLKTEQGAGGSDYSELKRHGELNEPLCEMF